VLFIILYNFGGIDMFKKVVMTLTILSTLTLSTIAFAAPATVGVNEQGTTSGLIVITNPESTEVSVSQKEYVISGYGQEGTNVCLYLYSPSENLYRKVVINGRSIEWEIGASRLFMLPVTLDTGSNKLMVRAEKDVYTYEIIKLDITLLKEGFLDRIKGLTIDIWNMVK